MSAITVIQGVDETLRAITTNAVEHLNPVPGVTVGPLDRDSSELRLNWFLYRVSRNEVFQNLSPADPTGPRGNPPLALRLHYLLTSFPGALTTTGDEDAFAHVGLAAVMQALHVTPILSDSSPFVSSLAKPLAEPLRLTMGGLDLDAVTKLWTSVAKPIRLSVSYDVDLVVVDSPVTFRSGPPVQEIRQHVSSAPQLRLLQARPERFAATMPVALRVSGATPQTRYLLGQRPGDPDGGADGWPLTIGQPSLSTPVVQLDNVSLAPGLRPLFAVDERDGVPAASSPFMVGIVPLVTAAPPAAAGGTVALSAAHADPQVEAFLDNRPLPTDAVRYVSRSQVDIDLPGSTDPGSHAVSLRVNGFTGPPFPGLVVS